jgi:hypothetical protein
LELLLHDCLPLYLLNLKDLISSALMLLGRTLILLFVSETSIPGVFLFRHDVLAPQRELLHELLFSVLLIGRWTVLLESFMIWLNDLIHPIGNDFSHISKHISHVLLGDVYLVTISESL